MSVSHKDTKVLTTTSADSCMGRQPSRLKTLQLKFLVNLKS